MLPKYPIKAQNATNTESTDVAVFIVPDGAISGNEVDISAGGIAIGDTITDATEGSVLFAGAAGVLAQNNTAFKWVNADTQLQLTAGGATKTPLYIKLAATPTADAFQVYASDGTTKLAGITAIGKLEVSAGAAAPATSGIRFLNGISLANDTWLGSPSAGILVIGGNGYDPLWYCASGLFVSHSSTLDLVWSSTPFANGVADIGLSRKAAGVLKVTNGSTGAGTLEFLEQTAPSAATANSVRIYAQDNGAGKTQLMALFATGVAQQIAIEP